VVSWRVHGFVTSPGSTSHHGPDRQDADLTRRSASAMHRQVGFDISKEYIDAGQGKSGKEPPSSRVQLVSCLIRIPYVHMIREPRKTCCFYIFLSWLVAEAVVFA
jgi:hypothetical protein